MKKIKKSMVYLRQFFDNINQQSQRYSYNIKQGMQAQGQILISFQPPSSSPKWEDHIKPLLVEISLLQHSTKDIVQIIKYFLNEINVKRQMKGGWQRKKNYEQAECDFKVIFKKYYDQLPQLCAKLATIILRNVDIKLPMIHRVNVSAEYTFTKQEIFYVLSCMFFCLITPQLSDLNANQHQQSQYAFRTNFSHIFSVSLYKTTTIVQYLLLQVDSVLNKSNPQRMSICRCITNDPLSKLLQLKGKQPMTKLNISDDKDDIQRYFGQIKVDFANRYIGGGALGNGSVQEQIMFANHPQMYAAQILCQKMNDNQSLSFIGFRKYFCHEGYMHRVAFKGREKDTMKVDKSSRCQEYVIAIDALKYHPDSIEQFTKKDIDREIIKAYTGFSSAFIPEEKSIVTGNWGCGVFHGDHRTKTIIQWIAASLAGRNVVYCPFGKRKIVENQAILDILSSMSIQHVYQLLLKSSAKMKHKSENLYGYLQSYLTA